MNARSALTVSVLVAAGAALLGCQPAEQGQEEGGAAEGTAAERSTSDHVVEVTAVDYAFQAPDTIPAGWVTFRMTNKGTESHHFHFDRLPEGRTFAEWRKAFHEPADSVLRLLAEGKIDSAEIGAAIDQATADWAHPGNLQTHGGMGLVAPSRTGQATHRVEPGHYVLICVIRASDGRSHAELGMVDGLVAVQSSAGRSPPEPDATVRGVEREIRMDGTLTPGRRSIGFHVEEVPEGLRSGTDGDYSVWLARLDDTTDVQDVRAWDYANPAPYESLGGFEYLPPSDTAYVTADIEPGLYAWIWFYGGMDPSAEDAPLAAPFTVE